jgi:RNA ligase (TIGR02306 family)
MSTFEVPIVTIKSVKKHPNADSLDLIEFNEIAWVCVDKINIRKPNDLVVYVPIDSEVEISRLEFEFLKPRAKANGKARIRTIKLRGEISQGLILDLPKDIMLWLCKKHEAEHPNPAGTEINLIGQNVAEYFGITKYEPSEDNLTPNAAGSYPYWGIRSDAERYENYNRNIEPYLDEDFFQSVKVDGTSLSVFFDKYREENPIGVCSRNLEIKPDDEGANKWTNELDRPKSTNIYWEAAIKYDLPEKVKLIAEELNISRLIIQAEIVGSGVQGNKLGLTNREIRAFDIFNGDAFEFLPYQQFIDLCKKYEIPTVEIINIAPIREMVKSNFKIIDIMTNPNGTPIEGIVFVATIPRNVGKLGRLKFKKINPLFLLRYSD